MNSIARHNILTLSPLSPSGEQEEEEEDKQKAKTNNQRTHLKVEAGKCFQMRQYLRIHTYTYKIYIDKVCRETY